MSKMGYLTKSVALLHWFSLGALDPCWKQIFGKFYWAGVWAFSSKEVDVTLLIWCFLSAQSRKSEKQDPMFHMWFCLKKWVELNHFDAPWVWNALWKWEKAERTITYHSGGEKNNKIFSNPFTKR